jgi:hypothetical protein
LHFLAEFTRARIANAGRAYWYESGTIGGLVWNGEPTGMYWLYDWYGSMSGSMVAVHASGNQDGVASYDAQRRSVRAIVGGAGGTNAVQVKGLAPLGTSVTVRVVKTRKTGRHGTLRTPIAVSRSTMKTVDGAITLKLTAQATSDAYEVVIAAHD